MAKLLLVVTLVAVLLTVVGLNDAFPSRFHRHRLSRSIADKLEGPQGIDGPKGGDLGPKDGILQGDKDLLNGPKEFRGKGEYGGGDLDGEGLHGFSGGYGAGSENYGGPKGYPKYGRGGPESLPGPFGPEDPQGGGLNFGPEGPCMSKRCNPFRSRRPSYRSYLRQMRRNGGPYGPFGPPQPMGPPIPVMTEIIIVRKIPILLSKLIVVASADKVDKGKYKPGENPYPPQQLPEGPGGPEKYPGGGEGKYPAGGKPLGPGNEKPDNEGWGSGSEEDVLLQDPPGLEKKRKGGPEAEVPDYQELAKSKGVANKDGPPSPSKDKDFDESMGEEVDLTARAAYYADKDKLKPEALKKAAEKGDAKPLDAQSGVEYENLKKEVNKKVNKETKLKYDEKEYLEKPGGGLGGSGPNKANWDGAANELEPRNETELEASKFSPKY